MSQTKQRRARSFAEEGTVYWLIVSALVLVYLPVSVASTTAGILLFLYLAFAIALAAVEAALAYTCWTMKKWSFIASTISAIIFSGLTFGILYSPIGTAIIVSGLAFEILYSPIGNLLLLLQLQVVLFSYRALREPKQLSVQPS